MYFCDPLELAIPSPVTVWVSLASRLRTYYLNKNAFLRNSHLALPIWQYVNSIKIKLRPNWGKTTNIILITLNLFQDKISYIELPQA